MAESDRPVTTRSTSGAGFAFEDLVGADLLSRFLIDAPIYGIGVAGSELLFQARAAGWIIDDLVCVSRDAEGCERRLALSCKGNVQVSGSSWPADFIADAWKMWRGDGPFQRDRDKIGLVTRGRNPTFDAAWSDLKTSCVGGNPDLALGRIAATAKSRRMFDSMRLPGERDGEVPSDVDTLAFMAALEIFPVGFQLEPSATRGEALLRCRGALCSQSNAEAEDLWESLVRRAEAARVGNGTIRLTDLLRALAPRFALVAHPSIAASWTNLLALSEDHLATIGKSLTNGHIVARPQEEGLLAQALREQRQGLVIGDSGTGKSVLVRRVLGETFPDATQVWLGPEALSAAIGAATRRTIGVDHPLGLVLEHSPGADTILVLDSLERLDAPSLSRLEPLLKQLVNDVGWRIVAVSQLSGLDGLLQALKPAAAWTRVAVADLPDAAVSDALASEASLSWIAADPSVLPLLANLQTLDWVIAAASSFAALTAASLTSAAGIADHLWTRWTIGPATTQLQGLLMRLSVREARFERSFRVSELDQRDLAAFDQGSPDLPLVKNARNRIEFRHDLASDWARYQWLKEIADDVEQWAPLARQPLWIGALRLFGQHLLEQSDQSRDGWDRAYAAVTAAEIVEAADVLLDALCLHPNLDQYLATRAEFVFASEGALLKRLLHRFYYIASMPRIPPHIAAEPGMRIYLEAEMRVPIVARWVPMGRFLRREAERIGALGAPIVARVCKLWLSAWPATMQGQPTPLRDIIATIALETARTHQVHSIARRFFGGDGDAEKAIYTTALAGAPDNSEAVSAFALEMARRRPLSTATSERIEALRAADQARIAAVRDAGPRQRRQSIPGSLMSSREELPPWPLGAGGRLDQAFCSALLHVGALTPLMTAVPAVASEVLLACVIEDQPTRDYGRSTRIDEDLGLEYDQESYPTIFWKSPFFHYLSLRPGAALTALKQLVDFAMERWGADIPEGRTMPALTLTSAIGTDLHFPGNGNSFSWGQRSSSRNGQLFCALDALERWLTVLIDAGEDVTPWCERLLAEQSSTAILGVLVNIGKYQPPLFKSVLAPLAGSEWLYWWDGNRIKQASIAFDGMWFVQQGEAMFNMARDWAIAPHRRKALRTVIGELVAEDAEFGARVSAAAADWPVPSEPEDQFEQRMLRCELDTANWRRVVDAANGEATSQIIYPEALREDGFALKAEATEGQELLTLPYQCEKALASNRELAEESAAYLAEFLPGREAISEDVADRRLVAAVAATLIARGGTWIAERPDARAKAERAVRDIIAADADETANREPFAANEALRFAGIGALHAAMQAEASVEWNPSLIAVLTSGDQGAIEGLMWAAERERNRLGPAWYRLNFLLLVAAALNRLAPMRNEDEEEAKLFVWRRWRERLCAQPIFDVAASIAIVDARGIARRAERLLERRRARANPERPFRLSGRSRRFAGVSTHILEAGYAWLLHLEAREANAQLPENHCLLAALWAFEAWRMEGERDDDEEDEIEADSRRDEEYDLPSQMGYAILGVAGAFVMAEPADNETPLWRAILAIGPAGHYAIEQFASSWFLLLFGQPDADRFVDQWKAMVAMVFAPDWGVCGRWYRRREIRTRMLGLLSPKEIGQADAVCARIPELLDTYRLWAHEEMVHDQSEMRTLAYFLTTEAGRALRMEGMLWLSEALTTWQGYFRDGTGNSIAEAVDTLLREHASEIVTNPPVRDAMIEIVAKLVRAQAPAAMGLQQRIAVLR